MLGISLSLWEMVIFSKNWEACSHSIRCHGKGWTISRGINTCVLIDNNTKCVVRLSWWLKNFFLKWKLHHKFSVWLTNENCESVLTLSEVYSSSGGVWCFLKNDCQWRHYENSWKDVPSNDYIFIKKYDSSFELWLYM